VNALYHVAVIEGFLSNSVGLPDNVKEAIEFLKQANAPVEPKATIANPKKKKRRMTAEQRQKMNEHMAKMWEVRKQKMEAKKVEQIAA
jgi:hypothetical protein